MNDIFWDYFIALSEAEMTVRNYTDRLKRIYKEFPPDLQPEASPLAKRLEQADEILNESAVLMQMVKEAILSDNY